MSTRQNFTRISTPSLLLCMAAASAAAQGGITGRVFDSLSTRGPLANATVVLVERSKYATTDARGNFTIDSVPDGHYTLGFMHPLLDSLELQAPVVAVDVTGGRRAAVDLFTPSAAAAYALICPGPRDTDTGVIIGRVRDVDDASSLANATVSTEWTEITLTAGRAAGHRVRAAAKTNAQGAFLLCGVPKEVPVDVHGELGGFVAGPTPLMPDDRLIRRLDFAISRRDSAARSVSVGDSSKVAMGVPGSGTLRGVVLGAEGRPVREAIITVFGTARTTRTNAKGAFRLDQIPAGTRTVEVRAIGLLPLTLSMDFATSATRDTTISVSRQAQDMGTVAVRERASSTAAVDNGGFDARKTQGLGKFITQTDIVKNGATNLSDILAKVPGIIMDRGTSGYPLPLMKGVVSVDNTARTQGAYCIPTFFLDGVHVYVDGALKPKAGIEVQPQHPFSDLADAARPDVIKGIEVYANPGTIPLAFDNMSSTGCGSIVIWTRER